VTAGQQDATVVIAIGVLIALAIVVVVALIDAFGRHAR
jgi:hypothetical protein